MDMRTKHAKVDVPAQGTVALQDAVNRRVTCLNGLVWLTMEDDQRDVVLQPGVSFVIDRDGLTLLTAQRPSSVHLSAQVQTGRNAWRALVGVIDRMWGPAALRSTTRYWGV